MIRHVISTHTAVAIIAALNLFVGGSGMTARADTKPDDELGVPKARLWPDESDTFRTGNQVEVTLRVKWGAAEIQNMQYQTDKAFHDVRLLGPHYTNNNEGKRLVGPTLRLRRLDNVAIHLDSQWFTTNSTSEMTIDGHPLPASRAETNLQFEGINGIQSSDVKLVSGIGTYRFRLSKNQKTGSFWYHPAVSNSQDYQIASGMAGAIIIEDDLNEICHVTTDRVILLQQIHGISGIDHLKNWKDDQRWFTDPSRYYGEEARIRGQKSGLPSTDIPLNKHSPRPDPASKDDQTWLLVNGVSVPTFEMTSGDFERWRFIHAGRDEAINVALVDTENNNCHVTLRGLYDGRQVESQQLDCGKTWEVLFVAPHTKTAKYYYLIDDILTSDKTLYKTAKGQQAIAIIKVNPKSK